MGHGVISAPPRSVVIVIFIGCAVGVSACGPQVAPPSSAVPPVYAPLTIPPVTTAAPTPPTPSGQPAASTAAGPRPARGGVPGLRPMNDGDRLYHQFCLNHDDSAGCSDFRDDALRRRGIDPSSATPDFPP